MFIITKLNKKLYKLLILFLSSFNILKSKIKKIEVANYFIIETANNRIDRRSIPYFKIINLNNTINIIRQHEFSKDLFFLMLKIPNSVSFSLIQELEKSYFKNSLIKKLFIFLNIKKIILIDDYRVMKIFSNVCKDLSIFSIIYMHGKLSKNSQFLKDSKFSKYIVWSDYFKSQIHKANHRYKPGEVVVLGHPHLKKINTKKNNKIRNCLILDEDYIQFNEIKNYLTKIVNLKQIKFFLKKKITRELPSDYYNFCKKNKVKIIDNKNFYKSIITFNIDSVIAFTSTGLLESSYYNLLPIKLKNKRDDLDHFVKDGMIFQACSPKELFNLLNKRINNEKIKKIRYRLWSNSFFNKKKLQVIYRDLFMEDLTK
jgi:hypothetical protein